MIRILVGLLLLGLVVDQNITISNTIVEDSIVDVQWCGAEIYDLTDIIDEEQEIRIKKVLFSRSTSGIVYKSFDNGKQWYQLQNVFEKQIKEKLNKDIEKIKIQKMVRSKADNQQMYFVGEDGLSFFSHDCGANFQVIQHDSMVKDVKPNQSNNRTLVLVGNMDCNKYPVICKYANWIYLSDDNGQTINKYDDMILEVEWAKYDTMASEEIEENRLIFTTIKQENQKLIQQVKYSDDLLKTSYVIDEKAYRFYISEMFLYLLRIEDLDQQQFSLAIAHIHKLGKSTSEQVKVPVKRLKDHSFTVLDSSYNQIFININHLGDHTKFGNVYQSQDGSKFILSLLYNVRSEDGYVDFKKLDSMEGSYIANHYEHSQAEKYKTMLDSLQNQNIDSNQQKQVISQYQNSLDQYKKSVISHDQGVSWQSIAAPAKDMYGQPIECSGECSLHFKGITDQHGNQIYSDRENPGIILGVGNVGFYLSNDPHEMNTYLSRDGGHSWIEVRKGSHHYTVGDKGGLIVLGKEHGVTDSLIYSWNEGISFQEIKVSSQSFQIKDIMIEPTNQALNFVVVGSIQQNDTFKNIVVGLDFESLHQRECNGHMKPNTPSSDYELWIPHIHKKDGCVMGTRQVVIRKKQGSECYNPYEFEQIIQYKSCPCQSYDFECDYGFSNVNGMCKPDEDNDLWDKPTNCRDKYQVKSGYIKLPGNQCEGGLDKDTDIYLDCREQNKIVGKAKQKPQTQEQKDQKIKNDQYGGYENKINADKILNDIQKGNNQPQNKNKKKLNLEQYEAYGENVLREQKDMQKYETHVKEVEMQETKFRDQQSIFNVNKLAKSHDNKNTIDQKSVKAILLILMVVCLLVFMKEHIIQMIITVQSRMKPKKYDYESAGEPTNRFDSQEFKALSQDDEF